MSVSASSASQIKPTMNRSSSSQNPLFDLFVQFLKYTVLIVLAFSFIFPFYWMLSSAVKNDSQVFTVPPIWLPIPAQPENFWNAWSINNFNLFLFNTVALYAIPVTIGVTLSSAFVAYGFGRVKWFGRDVFFFLCVATMMIPYQVTMVPLFITFKNFGWINSYLPMVVPGFFGAPYFIFMLRQFYLTLPEELSDAARIDGASELVIFARIIMPLVKPALTVVALFSFMNAWNEYLQPLIYINQESLYPIALGLNNLRRGISEIGATTLAYPYLMAVSSIVTLPIAIVFFFTQRTFIEGISLTGLKG
ncbi:MAG: carbohydrate ABC transporter permease [Chloroflexota bacterium]